MRTLVRVVQDADDDPAVLRELVRAHNPSAGVVVVRPTPGRGGPGIARDLLRTLGKRFDIAGTPRSAARLFAPTLIWIAAEHTRYLVITRAHLLHRQDWTTLLALRHAGLEELWFVVHEPMLSTAHRQALTGVQYSEIEPAEMASHLPHPKHWPRPNQPPLNATRPSHLPTSQRFSHEAPNCSTPQTSSASNRPTGTANG